MKQGMRQGQNTVYQEILHFEKVSFLVIRTRTGIKNSLKATSSKTPVRTTLRKAEKLKEVGRLMETLAKMRLKIPSTGPSKKPETRAKAISPPLCPKEFSEMLLFLEQKIGFTAAFHDSNSFRRKQRLDLFGI